MKYKVLYIDDETTERSQTYTDGLSTAGKIEISITKPTIFEELLSELVEEQGSFDALILDLKLDGNQQGDRTATYTAPSLATGIRTKFFNDDGFSREFPIFLISSTENLKKYFDPDTSSHDLFDFTFTKTDVGNRGKEYEVIIESFIVAYQTIQEDKTNFIKILGIYKKNQIIDRIFTTRFLNGEGTSASEISQYIFDEIILKSGVLIGEDTLAARFGVDYKKSDDWPKLLQTLTDVKYSGVFSNSIERWWWDDVLNWWNHHFSGAPLIRLDAVERVKLIKEYFGFTNITDAKPIDKTTSTKFWTICQAFKKPLDPKDGFLVDGFQLYQWQDKRYLSLESILEREAKNQGLRIHPAEKERFEEIKQEYV